MASRAQISTFWRGYFENIVTFTFANANILVSSFYGFKYDNYLLGRASKIDGLIQNNHNLI